MTIEERQKQICEHCKDKNSCSHVMRDNCEYLSNVMYGWELGYRDAVNKACEWLEENLTNYWGQLFANYYGQINAKDTEQFIKNFRKAMEE